MAKITKYENSVNEAMVAVDNGDETLTYMTQVQYDAQQAAIKPEK